MSGSKPKAAGKDHPGRSRLSWRWILFSAGSALSVPAAADSPDAAQGLTAAEARGRIIYTTGHSPAGELLYFRLLSAGRGLLPAKGVACASCHGADGKGGREGNVVIADLSRAAYTDDLLARAITEGVDASGRQLDGMMPRWRLQNPELQDLVRYLRRLGRHDRR